MTPAQRRHWIHNGRATANCRPTLCGREHANKFWCQLSLSNCWADECGMCGLCRTSKDRGTDQDFAQLLPLRDRPHWLSMTTRIFKDCEGSHSQRKRRYSSNIRCLPRTIPFGGASWLTRLRPPHPSLLTSSPKMSIDPSLVYYGDGEFVSDLSEAACTGGVDDSRQVAPRRC